MTRLAFALTAATAIGIATPAGAQSVYVDSGGCDCPAYAYGWGGPSYAYAGWGSPGYAYGYWDEPRVGISVRAPGARVYVDESGPRYRYRRYSRDWDDGFAGYAYGGGPRIGYRNWDGSGVSIGFGNGYGYGWRGW